MWARASMLAGSILWTVTGLPGCGGEEDAGVSPPTDGSVLEVTAIESWRGDFGSSGLEYKNIPFEQKGPAVVADGTRVGLTWRKAVYQDCEGPAGFRVARDPQASARLSFTLFPRERNAVTCASQDVFADVTTQFALPAGTWELRVDTTLRALNQGTQNVPPQTLTLDVP